MGEAKRLSSVPGACVLYFILSAHNRSCDVVASIARRLETWILGTWKKLAGEAQAKLICNFAISTL